MYDKDYRQALLALDKTICKFKTNTRMRSVSNRRCPEKRDQLYQRANKFTLKWKLHKRTYIAMTRQNLHEVAGIVIGRNKLRKPLLG